ncbi:MAG: hypothetical protein AAF713_02250 [Pseudomonadota bacterium]
MDGQRLSLISRSAMASTDIHEIGAAEWPVAWPERPVAAAFWLAQAARQDLWRAAQRIRGFRPAIAVEIGVGQAGVTLLAAGVRQGPTLPDSEVLFRKRAQWTAWALRRAGG